MRIITLFVLLLVSTLVSAAKYEQEFVVIEDRFERIAPHIVEQSLRAGVDVNLVTTVAYTESRFVARAKNSRSSARGIMQITRPTARALLRTYGAELGLKPNANLNDPVVSIKLGTVYLREVEQALRKSLKRKPNHEEIYLGYKYSPRRAVAMIKRGHKRMLDFYPAAADGNRSDYFTKGKSLTMRETRQKISGKFRTAAAFYGPKIKPHVASYRSGFTPATMRAFVNKTTPKPASRVVRARHLPATSNVSYAVTVFAAEPTSGRKYMGVSPI